MPYRSKKKSRRSRKRSNNSLAWIIAGAVGIVMLVIAALALNSRGESTSGPGQWEFDQEFEPEVSGAPRVEVVQDELVDYGNVKLNTTITTTYTVRNVGDEQLVLLGEPRVELVEGC